MKSVINPATAIASELIAPSSSPISIAFAVPKVPVSKILPIPIPTATGWCIRKNLQIYGAETFPITPVIGAGRQQL